MSPYLDLTWTIDTGHWRYPNFIKTASSIDEGGSHNVRYMDLKSHWFSHIDAPRHSLSQGATLEEFIEEHDLLSKLIGKASIIDVSDCVPNEALGKARLEEAFNQGCLYHDFLFVKTAWGRQRDFSTEEYWLDAPHVTAEGAEYLRSLNPAIVAFDFPQDHDTRIRNVADRRTLAKPTHDILLCNDILMIEYLNYLWNIPPQVKNVDVFALPLKVKNADGAQIRVVVRY